MDDPNARGAHTARRARPTTGQPTGGNSRVIQYRPLEKCHKMSAMIVARGEPLSLWIPPSAKDYIDMKDPPDECFFYATHAHSKYDQHEQQVQLQTHALQKDIAQWLWETLDDVYATADIAQFQQDVLTLAEVAKEIADRRFACYHRWAKVNSNNRARMLEMQAYQFLANGLLVLGGHIDVDEPRKNEQGLYRYCSNEVIAELLDFALAFVDPTCANKCDLAERWQENAHLWVARDAEPKINPRAATQYQLVLRNSKNALSRSDPRLRP